MGSVMRAVVQQSVFEGDGVDTLELLELIGSAASRNHTMVVTEPTLDQEDASQPVNQWIDEQQEQLAARLRLLLREWAVDDPSSPGDRFSIEVVDGDSSSWDDLRLSVADAKEILLQPLKLMLENEEADWLFLHRIADPSRKESLDRARENHALELRHAGGLGHMKTTVEKLAADLDSSDDAKRADAANNAVRMWIMFDRDGAEDDRRLPSAASDAVVDACENVKVGQWRLAFHRLVRRSIENYLPGDALWTWAHQGTHAVRRRRRETVQSYLSQEFGSERRHSYDMKEGLLEFAGTGQERGHLRDSWQAASTPMARTVVVSEIQPMPPFDLLSDELRFRLLVGFGKDVADAFANQDIADASFQIVFDNDRDAYAEREQLFGALFRRL